MTDPFAARDVSWTRAAVEVFAALAVFFVIMAALSQIARYLDCLFLGICK